MAKNPELNAARRKRRLSDEGLRDRQNEYSRNYRAKTITDGKRAEHSARTRQYRVDNQHITFYTTSRYLAGKAGVTSDLTVGDALDIYNTPNVCAYCGKDCGEVPEKRAIHIDHIIPMIQGGHNTRWNITKACHSCNTSKGSASLIDFRGRTSEFTQERYNAVLAGMVARSGHSAEHITFILGQSHAFEIAYQAERERMLSLLAV
jgi:5-methylcytosine-specific restriction endonuclease McrA